MKRKIIAIIGPTTAPGRGLIRAILGDKQGDLAARALTRDLASEEAQLLAMTGIEVSQGELDDEAMLRRAFADAHGVFCFLLSKDAGGPGASAPTQARALAVARACKAAAVAHVVWGMLDDTALLPLRDEEATPTYFDGFGDAKVEAPIDTRHPFTELVIPTTFLQTTWHSRLMTGRTAEEIGQHAYRIFRNPELVGKTVPLSEERLAEELARPPVVLPAAAAPGRISRTATAWLLGAFAAVVLGSVAVMSQFYRQPSEVVRQPAVSARTTSQPRSTRSFGPLKARDPVIAPVINPVTTADTNLEEPPSMLSAPANHARPKRHGGRFGQPEHAGPGGARREVNAAPMPSPPTAFVPAAGEPRGPTSTAAAAPARVEQGPPPPTSGRLSAGPIANRAPTVSSPAPASAGSPAGSIDPRAVSATVRAHAAEVRACFDRALMEHADLHGRLVVKAILDASGSVISASAVRTMDGGGRLEACVLAAFESWAFPAPANGGRAPISYSFSFE